MTLTTHLDPPALPARKGRRMVIMLLAVGTGLGLLVAFNLFKNMMIKRALAGDGEPPQAVSTQVVRPEAWQPTLTAVGTIRAFQGADLAFEVPGVVAGITAKAGMEVKQGQPLVSLEDGAEAAALKQLQTAARLAGVTFTRVKAQRAANAVSQADFDNAEADFEGRQAALQSQAAQLAKKHLVAPFAGRVGIITASPGAYLNAGTSVVTLQQLRSVFVDFHLPQKEASLVHPGQRVTLSVDGLPGRTFQGKVTGINPKVDPGTRNIQVEALFANPGSSLLPGMFTRVTMDVGTRQDYLTLPQTAISYNPYGAIAFMATQGKAGMEAQQVFVTTGATRGDQVAILSGLKEGAQVVTSGGLKLRNGTPLHIDNRAKPASDANPAPQEQ